MLSINDVPLQGLILSQAVSIIRAIQPGTALTLVIRYGVSCCLHYLVSNNTALSSLKLPDVICGNRWQQLHFLSVIVADLPLCCC